MIVVLEGAPAVGKSSLAAASGLDVIPEVNQLFGKKPAATGDNDWYLQRQLDRWRLACAADAAGRSVLLDGDLFQPLWFSAHFWQEDWGDLDALLAFYRQAMAAGQLALPDRFICLSIDEAVRADRERARCAARGRPLAQADAKIARYAGLAPHLRSYFGALEAAFPGLVAFQETAAPVADSVAWLRAQTPGRKHMPLDVLDFIGHWCRSQRARHA